MPATPQCRLLPMQVHAGVGGAVLPVREGGDPPSRNCREHGGSIATVNFQFFRS